MSHTLTPKPGLPGGHIDLHIPLDRPGVVEALAVFMSTLAGLPIVTPATMPWRVGGGMGEAAFTPAPGEATVPATVTETVDTAHPPVPALPATAGDPQPPTGGRRRTRQAAAVQTATGQAVPTTAVDTMSGTAASALEALGIAPPAAAVDAAQAASAAAVVASVPVADNAALAVALGAAPAPVPEATPEATPGAAAPLPDTTGMAFAQDFADAEAVKRAAAEAQAAAEAAAAAKAAEEARQAGMGHNERIAEAASLARLAQTATGYDIRILLDAARGIMGCERFADCPPDKSQALLDMVKETVAILSKAGRLVVPAAAGATT